MGKRANGEGTISKRMRDGKVVGWRTAVTLGYDDQGRQIRRWVSGRTQAEVQTALRKLQAELQADPYQDVSSGRSDLTLAAFLDKWVDFKAGRGAKANTVRSYSDTARLYITPHLGQVKLQKLRTLDVEQLLTRLHQIGKSPAILAYTLGVLKMALRQAVKWQLVVRNVAEAVDPPTRQKPEMQVWTASQAATFLKEAESHRLYAAFYLALMTGMRRGEILGLTWADIDWEGSRLKIRNNLVEVRRPGKAGKYHAGKSTISSVQSALTTPKTTASCRTIVLSSGTMARLQEHRCRQKHELQLAGLEWTDDGFVFTNESGGKTEPRSFYGWYRQIKESAGLPHIRFHDLRHTAASLMFKRGLSPKVVSDRLGHADVAFTMRIYTHLYDEQREEAAFDLSDLLPSASPLRASFKPRVVEATSGSRYENT